jgi:glycosyltransferase involved in cell wall biosynthesis
MVMIARLDHSKQGLVTRKLKLSADQKICAIIPAYNEQASIVETISDLQTHRPDIIPIVVDDGSTDRTAELARIPGVILLQLPVNLGIGGTVQTGLKYAHEQRFDLAVQFDGDGQHIASEIHKILEPIVNGEADVVIGSRFLEPTSGKVSVYRRSGIRVLMSVIALVTGRKFTDSTSGFRAYGPTAIEYLADDYPQDYPEPEAIVDLHRHCFRLTEVSVKMRQRQGGQTSISPSRSIYYMTKVILATLVASTRRHHS